MSEFILYCQLDDKTKTAIITGCDREKQMKDFDFVVPSNIGKFKVTTIGDFAFEGYEALTSLTIPDTIERIEDGAFKGCINLKEVYIPESVNYLGDNAFDKGIALTRKNFIRVKTRNEE